MTCLSYKHLVILNSKLNKHQKRQLQIPRNTERNDVKTLSLNFSQTKMPAKSQTSGIF